MSRRRRRGRGNGGDRDANGNPMKFKTQKEQGEWAELCFMMRAKGLGFGVLKPFGDSRMYDVAVEDGGPIVRVQVKCTTYCRRGKEYSLNILGPGAEEVSEGVGGFLWGVYYSLERVVHRALCSDGASGDDARYGGKQAGAVAAVS